MYKAAPPIADDPLDLQRFYMVVTAGAENEYEVVYSDFDSLSNGNDVIIYCVGYWGESNHPLFSGVGELFIRRHTASHYKY